eukprot:COSAG06_NODE_63255_length_262_cov_42.926380_1_plen_67_part_01
MGNWARKQLPQRQRLSVGWQIYSGSLTLLDSSGQVAAAAAVVGWCGTSRGRAFLHGELSRQPSTRRV